MGEFLPTDRPSDLSHPQMAIWRKEGLPCARPAQRSEAGLLASQRSVQRSGREVSSPALRDGRAKGGEADCGEIADFGGFLEVVMLASSQQWSGLASSEVIATGDSRRKALTT